MVAFSAIGEFSIRKTMTPNQPINQPARLDVQDSAAHSESRSHELYRESGQKDIPAPATPPVGVLIAKPVGAAKQVDALLPQFPGAEYCKAQVGSATREVMDGERADVAWISTEGKSARSASPTQALRPR